MEPPPYDEKPEYSASLEFYGVALAKVELDTPWNNHSDLLRPVVVELNSNQLKLYHLDAPKTVTSALRALFAHQNYADKEVRAPAAENRDYMFDGDAYGDDCYDDHDGVLGKLRKHYLTSKMRKRLRGPMPLALLHNRLLLEPTTDGAEYARFAVQYRGALVRSYTLLNLMVGEAPSVNLRNYKEDGAGHTSEFALLNYRNVLRLRVEFSQLLLHFWSFYGMVHWYRRLCIGRDLALLLDTRRVAPLKSIPRAYSARNNMFFTAHHDVVRKPRASLESDMCDAASEGSDGLSSSGVSSGVSMASSVYSEEAAESVLLHVTVYGHRIVCYEDRYLPLEKQYISNCIGVLNSFDKWVGRKVTISNFRYILPKNDGNNVNEGDRVFISRHTFNALARTYAKTAPTTGISQCKEFMVEPQGLVSVEG